MMTALDGIDRKPKNPMWEATKREVSLKDDIADLIFQNLTLLLQAQNTDLSTQAKQPVKAFVGQLFDVNAVFSFMEDDDLKLSMLAQQLAGTANIGANGKVELTGLSKDISTLLRPDNPYPPSLFEKALNASMIFLGVSKSRYRTYFMVDKPALMALVDSKKSSVAQSIRSFKTTKKEMDASNFHFLGLAFEKLLWENIERNLRRKGDGFMYPAIEFNIRVFLRQLLSQLPKDFFVLEETDDFTALADKIAGKHDLYGTGELTGLSALIYQAGNTPDKTSAERYFDEFKHKFGFHVDYHTRFAITSDQLTKIQTAGLDAIKAAKAELVAAKKAPDSGSEDYSPLITPLANARKDRKKDEKAKTPTHAPKNRKTVTFEEPKKSSRKKK